jgi:hypothetical protein
MGRVLKPGGRSLIQMTNFFGLRNLQIQLMRGFRKTLGRSSFHTRYWLPTELSRLFTDAIGPSSLEVEGFFSTSSGSYYMKSLPIFYRVALTTSRVLSSLSRVFVPLRYAADSVYMRSTRKTDDTNAASV